MKIELPQDIHIKWDDEKKTLVVAPEVDSPEFSFVNLEGVNIMLESFFKATEQQINQSNARRSSDVWGDFVWAVKSIFNRAK